MNRKGADMKCLLMIAASVLAFAGAAQAEAPSLRSLPEAMLGGWCASGQTGDDVWSSSTYFRSKRGECGGDWMRLRGRGYVETVGEPVTCRFISIHQIDKARFAVTARCQAEESPWHTEQLEFSLSGAVLTGSVKLRM
jgi:hypothetical protein